jgi:hypothetical protein
MAYILPRAEKWWKDKCRVTACVSNVVTMDGVSTPVQWLEENLDVFHQQFLDSDPIHHYYTNEIILRGPGAAEVTATDVRIVFAEFNVVRVSKRFKYYYATFRTASDTSTALWFAQRPKFKIKSWVEPDVKQRPMLGLTKFVSVRPFNVKDVCASTCVCGRCYKPKLMCKPLFSFKHWDIVCPAVADLVRDARNFAHPFSPSIDNVLDVILCARPVGGFFKKACCQGRCDQCGWDKLGVLSPKSSIPAEKPLIPSNADLVHGKQNGNVQFLNIDPDEAEVYGPATAASRRGRIPLRHHLPPHLRRHGGERPDGNTLCPS